MQGNGGRSFWDISGSRQSVLDGVRLKPARKGALGPPCLMARRLSERGCALVENLARRVGTTTPTSPRADIPKLRATGQAHTPPTGSPTSPSAGCSTRRSSCSGAVRPACTTHRA